MTGRPTRMGRLVRFSRLKEEKATHSWLIARSESDRARDARDQAVSALGDITEWKTAGMISGALNVDHYLLALDLEAGAAEKVLSRDQALQESELHTQGARELLESAQASLKGAERRQLGQVREQRERAEKSAFDDVRDLWLARPGKNHE